MAVLTETRMASSAPDARVIPMTSFDDERPNLAQVLPVATTGRSRHNSLARSRGNSVNTAPVEDRSLYAAYSDDEIREYHTGFFLLNIILRLWDEARRASAHGNTLIELKTQVKPTLQRFRHLTPGGKVNLIICCTVFGFVLTILPIPILLKMVWLGAMTFIVTSPILSQFFFYATPVLAWVFFFFSQPNVPLSMKPPISVKFLPAIETIFYGDNLSDILAAYHNTFLDLLAWFPYGIVHFALPFVVAALVWLFGPPTALRSVGFSYGYMNLIGVLVQQLFPMAPPWYKNLYGLAEAHYGMSGSPGGLGRIDDLFGFDMYTTTFSKNSPVIFGAFPSLHAGSSSMNALWLSYLFPKYRKYFVAYVFWLWWSTMYLTHHYFFDLTAGTGLAITFFYIAKYTSLPVKRDDRWCRFNYEELEYYDAEEDDPFREDRYAREIDVESLEDDPTQFTYLEDLGLEIN